MQGQNCENASSTNPSNPSNEDELFNNYTNPWLNTFDIGKNNGISFNLIKLNPTAGWDDAGLSSSDTLKMFNPFDIGSSPNAPYLSNPSGNMLNRDWHWEDGWELLYLGTGFYPDGSPVNTFDPSRPVYESQPVLNAKVPYMIYYNRYKGIIRVFVGVFVPFGSAQDITVDLQLNRSLSDNQENPVYNGLLRHLNSFDSPLDQETTVINHRGVNSTVDFNIRKWYSYDFQVGYDPCVCGKQSVLDFTLSAVQTSNVSLYGRMISVEEPLADANGKPIYNQDFLTATSILEQDPNGYVLKSSLDSLIGDYQKNLTIYKEQMADREFGKIGWIGDMLKKNKKILIGGATGLVPTLEIAEWLIEKKLNTDGDWGSSSTANIDTSKVKKFVINSSKGILGQGFDFLSSQIFDDKPVRPSRPVATFSEMRFSGDIITTNSTTLQGFMTPGSNFYSGGLTAFNYPAYNEALGLYATLRTPKIQYWSKHSPITETDSSVVVVDSTDFDGPIIFVPQYVRVDSTVYKSKTIEQEIYIKIKEPIEYALNNALDFDMKKTKVYVSFQVVLENAKTFPNAAYQYPNRVDSTINLFSDSTNLWSLHDIAQTSSTQHPAKRRVELVSGWSKIQDVANLLFGTQFSTTIYYNEYYNKNYTEGGENWWNPHLNYFSEEVPLITEETLKYRPVKITMKIMADMYFDQLGYSGNEINTTQIFTYLIFDESKDVDLIGDQENYLTDIQANDFLNGFVQMFPGVLTIQSDIITPQSPEVIWPNNKIDPFLVRAEQIKIDKVVKGPNGNPYDPLVQIVAHDNIRLLPGAHIKPSIVLKIDKAIYEIPEAHPAMENEITQFCDNSYNANTLASHLQKPNSENSDRKLQHKEMDVAYQNSNISIHPNPANFQVRITSTSKPISEVKIFDLSGRSLIHKKTGKVDIKQVELDINTLQSGVYIVQTICGDEHSTQKLVVGK